MIKDWLIDNNFAGFIMNRTDEFRGEYLPACGQRLQYLTGFTGSAGFLVAGVQKSAVFTDGRYELQIQQQIDTNIYEPVDITKTKPYDWIIDNFSAGDVIAYDSWLFTPNEIKTFTEKLSPHNITLCEIENPIDLLWQNKPPKPNGAVSIFPIEHAGTNHTDKIKMIAEELNKKDLSSCILTMTCSIAWTFNIRGTDVPFNPVVLAYAMINANETAIIYTDNNNFNDKIKNHLGGNVSIKSFNEIGNDLASGKIGIDYTTAPAGLIDMIDNPVDFKDVARLKKSFKNKAEIKSMIDCHITDGAVMARFLHWVDTTPTSEQNELKNSEMMYKFRSSAVGFKDLSFDSISGFGENGAVIHYRVDKDSSLQFTPNNLYLIDSGSQYKNGTTDITRTVAIGELTQQHKQNFTLVLKAMIAPYLIKMPKDYTGADLDEISRKVLTDNGKNYAHGTGHGVGCGLNVHEAPLGISPLSTTTFGEGAILSNEPGYYENGNYGIRIENLMACRDMGEYYKWENLTWCPIDKRLIDKDMLNADELNWLNDYHQTVWEKVSPLLKDEQQVCEWLKIACENI